VRFLPQKITAPRTLPHLPLPPHPSHRMAHRHPQPTTQHTAPAATAPTPPPLDLSNIPQLLQQLLSDPNLDPHTLAQAIERLLLAQTLQTLADPTTPPPQRAAALQTYHQWRTTDLQRQRLQIARERLEISRQRLELQRQRLATQQPPPTDTPDPQVPTDPEELDRIILDQLDQILGLKPRTPKPISPNPAPPPPPAPPPDPQNPP